jgi:hypothetical protein
MKIVVGFSRAKSIFKFGSTAIQLAEKRNYGHAYVSFNCPVSDESLIAQASHGAVNMMNRAIFSADNIIVKEYELEIQDEDFKKVMTFVCKNLGKPYATSQIILIAIKKVLRFEVPRYNKDKYYICSEFAAKVCEILNIEVPLELDYFTPSDLDTLLDKKGLKYELF